MAKKVTASQEEINKLYDEQTFFDHGSNPALKKFMEIMVENNKEGRTIDHRTFVVDKYKKFLFARNFDDWLQRDCKCFTFTRAFAVWVGVTLGFGVAGRWSRTILPIGQHGIKTYGQTQFYHLYGPLGVVGVLGFYGICGYLWYKTTLFTGKKFYRHVILQDRQWIYEMERQNAGFGEYYFNDTPLAADENLSDVARGEMAKKKWEKPSLAK